MSSSVEASNVETTYAEFIRNMLDIRKNIGVKNSEEILVDIKQLADRFNGLRLKFTKGQVYNFENQIKAITRKNEQEHNEEAHLAKVTLVENTTAGEESPIDKEKRVARTNEIRKVFDALKNIDEKRKEMAKKDGEAYVRVVASMENIHDQVQVLADLYVNGDSDLGTFKSATLNILKNNNDPDIKEINTHRGWAKNLFVNLGMLIALLGVGYPVVCICKRGFFSSNTDSYNRVVAMEKEISLLKDAPSASPVSEDEEIGGEDALMTL